MRKLQFKEPATFEEAHERALRLEAEREAQAVTDERNALQGEIERLKIALGTALPYLISHRAEIDADDQRCIWHGATEPFGTLEIRWVTIPTAEYKALNRFIGAGRLLQSSDDEVRAMAAADIARELQTLDALTVKMKPPGDDTSAATRRYWLNVALQWAEQRAALSLPGPQADEMLCALDDLRDWLLNLLTLAPAKSDGAGEA